MSLSNAEALLAGELKLSISSVDSRNSKLLWRDVSQGGKPAVIVWLRMARLTHVAFLLPWTAEV